MFTVWERLQEKAKLLHSRDPAHYPDDSHKPEMAIALSDFQLLSSFRLSQEIYDNIKGSIFLLF